MSEPRDMDAPVTRREMHDALGTWTGAIVEQMSTVMSTAITTAISESERRVMGAVKHLLDGLESRLTAEIRGQITGSEEELATRLVAIDQQYKDLPSRVAKLEAKVFAPRKRRRRPAS